MKLSRLLLGVAVAIFSVLSFAKVNINTATADELASLHKIGVKKAQAIIAYRKKHGEFKKLEDLANVKGISLKMIKSFGDEISLSGKTTVNQKANKSSSKKVKKSKQVEKSTSKNNAKNTRKPTKKEKKN